jgi:riboflavin biosynthesis pyrimidine reductase
MESLSTLEMLLDEAQGKALPLPAALQSLYGTLRFPTHERRAHIIANFVTTLDGVVALEKGGGGPISGFNEHDRMVMGLLRAAAGSVVVAAGTVRPSGKHLWTAESIFPPLSGAYQELRERLGYTAPPLTVIVTGSGRLDPAMRVLSSGEGPVLIVTSERGAQQLGTLALGPHVEAIPVQEQGAIKASTVLELVQARRGHDLILVEGGPQLMNAFFAEQCLDELFLTLAPQVAGRTLDDSRPGLVMGEHFAPDNPRWAKLVGVHRTGDYLFLRYAFSRRQEEA